MKCRMVMRVTRARSSIQLVNCVNSYTAVDRLAPALPTMA